MDVWRETNWFAVQSKPNHEQLAAAGIARLDIEVFFPRVKQEQSTGGAKRALIKPLFRGYFFVRFCPFVLFDAVRYARGVLRLVGTNHFPIPIEPDVISSIKERVQGDGFIALEAKPFLPNDAVTIMQGPLSGWMGKVEREWDDGKRVLILLEAIQTARLLVEKSLLTLATESA
jgi:transcription antitermination factor NusG